MNAPERYRHALITVPEHCDGCMNCLRECPTEALRIRENTPVIREEFCIDCGACIVACPRKAILPAVESFDETRPFAFKVAVPSLVIYAQFGLDRTVEEIHLGLIRVGFHYVYDVFKACAIQSLAVQEHLFRTGGSTAKPFISSMCPAVVRLIQVKYPALVDHVLPFEPPRELTAREAKIRVAQKHGVDVEKVGAFYLSPCPAKSISVLQPAEKKRSYLDGVIAISDIYKPLRKAMAELRREDVAAFPREEVVFGSGWERTGFLSRGMNLKKWIAVAGLRHVIRILDLIEQGKLEGVDFIEANACIEGCVGGSLCVENIYIARSKIIMLEGNGAPARKPDARWVRQLYEGGYFFMQEKLKPRARSEPAPAIPDAILRMKRCDELVRRLPGLDCCACGAPTCTAFAGDVVAGSAAVEDCPYYASA